MKKRHIFFYKLFRFLTIVFAKIRFGYKYKKAENLPENYIVISNHVTDYDMIFVTASFKRQMYYVGSEHIARIKWLYKFLKYAFEPIMRYKGASAASTIIEMRRKVRNGCSVCLFAEGVRTWDGETCPIPAATAQFIKASGCGLVTYKIQGGYFASPMWGGASVRKGKIFGSPVNVYTKEQLANMSVEEIDKALNTDIYENAYDRQMAKPEKYSSKTPAEGLEALLYVCPKCNKYESFVSTKNKVECIECGFSFTYNQYGFLENSPYKTVKEFSDWQNGIVQEDVKNNKNYTSVRGALISLKDHCEFPVDEGEVVMNREVLRCGSTEFSMSDISDLAMHGRNALVFTANKQYYELKPNSPNVIRFLKYYKSLKEE